MKNLQKKNLKTNLLIIRALRFYVLDLNFRLAVYLQIGINSNTFFKKKILKNYQSIIGKSLYFPHPNGIVIGKNCTIGDSCIIYQNVTLGQRNGKYPIIGNNVVIYPSSIVLGDIIIGDNSIIGAGSIVIRNIPSNSKVAGNPARIIGKV